MFAKLVINGVEIEIGYEKLADMLMGIEDHSKHLAIFSELVHSPDPKVRQYVAERECINKALVDILLQDKQVDVLRALISNTNAAEFIEQDKLLNLISLEDSELLEMVARYIEYFELCDPVIIGQQLTLSDNPRVRGALADNPDAPETLLFILLEDGDSDIAASARQSLEIKREDDLDDNDEWDGDAFTEEDTFAEMVDTLNPVAPEADLQNLNYAQLKLLFREDTSVNVIQITLNDIPNTYSSTEWESLVKTLSHRWIQQHPCAQPGTIWLCTQINADTAQDALSSGAAFIAQFGLPEAFLPDLLTALHQKLQGSIHLTQQSTIRSHSHWQARCHVEYGKVWEPLDDITWVEIDNPEVQAVCMGLR